MKRFLFFFLLPLSSWAVTRTVTISAPASVTAGEAFLVPTSASTDAGGGEQIGFYHAEYSTDGGASWTGFCWDVNVGSSASRNAYITAAGAGSTVVVRVRIAFRGGPAEDVDYNGSTLDWDGTWNNWQTPPTKYAYISVVSPPNQPPVINWVQNPPSVYANQNFAIQSRGNDSDGNLSNVFVWKEWVPFAFDGGGNGYENYSDPNVTNSSVPGATINFQAQAYDSAGATSAVIYHAVTVLNRPPTVQTSASPTTIYFGQTTTVTSVATDLDGNLAFHGILVLNQAGDNWNRGAMCDHSTGWGNHPVTPDILSASYTSGVASGSTSTRSIVHRPSWIGTQAYHSNAHDGIIWADTDPANWALCVGYANVVVNKATPAGTFSPRSFSTTHTITAGELNAAFANPYSTGVAPPAGTIAYNYPAGTILYPGTYTVTATYAGDTNYNGASISAIWTVGNTPPAISITATPRTISFGQTTTVVATGSDVDGNLFYLDMMESSDGGSTYTRPHADYSRIGWNGYPIGSGWSGETFANDQIAPPNYGPVSIQATFQPPSAVNRDILGYAGDTMGNTGAWMSSNGGVLVVNKAAPAGTFSATTKTPQSGATYTVVAGDLNATFVNPYSGSVAAPTGAVTYSIAPGSANGTGGAAVTVGTTLTGGLIYTIRASYPGDGNYSGKTLDAIWTVNQGGQAAVTINSPSTGIYGSPYQATAINGSGTGAIVWSLGAAGTASGAAIDQVSGVVTASSVGTVNIKAYRAADANYAQSATTADFPITFGPRPITVTLAGSKIFDGTTTLTGATASITAGSLAGSDTVGYIFNNTSSASAGNYTGLTTATVSNAAAPATRTGSYAITYAGSYAITSLSAQGAVSITSSATAIYGNAYTATATGGDGAGAIVWSLGAGSTASNAAINSSTGAITANSTGKVVIKAYRAGDATYAQSATTADFTVTFDPRPITITLSGSKTYDGTTTLTGASASITSGSLAGSDAISYSYGNTASANAGTYFGFTSSLATDNFNRANANPISGNWGQSSMASPGLKLVNNAAAGAPSPDDSSAFENTLLWPADQYAAAAITTSGGSQNNGAGGGVAVRGTIGGETAYYAIIQSTGTNNLWLVTCVNGNWTPVRYTVAYVAGAILRLEARGTLLSVWYNGTFVGSITDFAISSGRPGLYVSQDGSSPVSSIDNFDAGNLVGDSDLVTVTLPNAANYSITYAGSYTIASASPSPVITSATTASGQVGVSFNYQIAASNSPTSFSATGLPAGLTLNAATGLISGTPTAAGTSSVTIGATNAGGTGTATLTLIINAAANTAPTITSIANQTTATGVAVGPLAFTVGDVETATGSLTVTKASSNTTLVPTANIALSGSGANRTVTVTPAASHTGTATITLTVSDGSLTTSTSFTLTVSANTAPTITSVANQTTATGVAVGPLAFTVGDAQTAAGSLTVTRTSSNTTLVPTANIVLGGSGASRTVTVTPAGSHTGTATITLKVSDGSLNTSTTFTLTVSTNTAPTITSVVNQTTSTGVAVGPLAFTVGDAQTAAGSLTVTKTSSNTTLLPTANIVLGGSGASRTVTVTPVAGQTGTATVTLTVSDGSLTSNSTFTLTVAARITPVILNSYGTHGPWGGPYSNATIANVVPAGTSRLLIVTLNLWESSGAASVSFGGVSLSRHSTGVWAGTGKLETWYLVNPPTTSGNVVITFNAPVGEYAAQAFTLSGVDQTTPLGAPAGVYDNNTSITLSPNSSETDLVLFNVVTEGDGVPSAGGITFVREELNDSSSESNTLFSVVGSVGSTSATITQSAGIAGVGFAVHSASASPSPAITSPPTASGQVGTPFNYQITASNSPTSFSATGLPAGLSVNTSTGVISGTPTAAATSSVTIGATNAGGTGTAMLTLMVSAANTTVVASDNFNRANGALGANWLDTVAGTTSVVSGNRVTSAISEFSVSRWAGTGTFTANQYTKITVINPGGAVEVTLRGTGSATAPTYYSFGVTGSAWFLYKSAGAEDVELSPNGTWPGGSFSPTGSDVIELRAIGSTLMGYINGVLIVTSVDAELATGLPGFNIYLSGVADNWEAGNLADTTAPSVPANLRLVSKTSTSVTVAWDATTDDIAVQNYDCRVGTNSPTTTTSLTATFMGLSPSTAYTFTVRARDTSGNLSNYSSVLSVTTNSSGVSLSTLQLTPAGPTLAVGATQQFTATAIYSDSSTQNVTGTVSWSSSNSTVATINSGGFATAMAAGNTTISATLSSVTGSTMLTVNPIVPAITGPTTAGGQTGAAFSYQITATNSPTSFSATGLPAGLTVNTSTGLISGTPTKPGTYTVTINATNAGGTASTPITITILASLPYTADFEAAEGYTTGTLQGQLGWAVSPGTASLTASDQSHGAQSVLVAASTPGAVVTQNFASTPTNAIEYFDFFAKPVAQSALDSAGTFTVEGAKFALQLNGGQGLLRVFAGNGSGGGAWTSTACSVSLGAGNQSLTWVRFTVRLDFTNKTWDMYANGAMVAADIPFISNSSTALSVFQMQGDVTTASGLDYIYAGPTNPVFGDTNNNGIDDTWETAHSLSLSSNNRNTSPTGNGITVIQAYVAGTNPTDFFNSAVPTLITLGGDNQVGLAGQFNELPFDMGVWNAAGTAPLVNAPVTFTVQTGGGGLSLTNTGAASSTVGLTTDGNGTATVYFQQPATPGVQSTVLFTAGTAQAFFFTTAFIELNAGNLTDLTDSDHDGLPDAWEMLYFHNLTSATGAMDSDGDGISNAAEYRAGTNPLVNEKTAGKPNDVQVVLRTPKGEYNGVKIDWSIIQMSP